MAMRSGLFNSEKIVETVDGFPRGDRAELADFFAKYFAAFIGNGVYPNPSTNFQVLAYDQMTIQVQPGLCFINGYFGWDTEATPITLLTKTTAHTYRVILRLNLKTRYITIETLEDNIDLTRNEIIWELALANISVPANSIIITQNNITDLRLDSNLCGLVHGVVDQIDTTTLGNQLQNWLNLYMEQTQKDYNKFLDFLQSIKNNSTSVYDALLLHFKKIEQGTEESYTEYLNYIAELESKGKGALAGLVDYFSSLHDSAQAEKISLSNYFSGLKKAADEDYLEFLVWLEKYEKEAQTNFETWFETIKGILGEDEAGALLSEIQKIQSYLPTQAIGEIVHSLQTYPHCQAYALEYGYGVGAYGENIFGGGSMTTIPAEFTLYGTEKVSIKSLPEFNKKGEFIRLDKEFYAVLFPDEIKNLIIRMW